MRRLAFGLLLAAGLGAAALAQESPPEEAPAEGESAEEQTLPTPMEDRVLTLAVLDKISQETQEFEASPGDIVRFGTLTIRVRACEATPPYADDLTGGFVQIDQTPRSGGEAQRVFSGWLFAESPSLNSFDHPSYDVWVRDCAMSFPETGPDTIVVD